MTEIRTMTAADIPLGMRLKNEAGWNQTEADWRRFLALEPSGCFVGLCDGRPAGTAVLCTFGDVAWVAMVLVDKTLRGQGLGTALVAHALAECDRRGIASVRLDATGLGRPIYEKLGFVAQFELARWEGVLRGGATDGVSGHACVRPCEPGDLERLAQLDRTASRTDRRRLLAAWLAPVSTVALRAYVDGDRWGGYLAIRAGTRATQIGPAVACAEPIGRALLDGAAAELAGRRVFCDIPADNRPASQWAAARGLAIQRPFIRMVHGREIVEDMGQLWASSGPELGDAAATTDHAPSLVAGSRLNGTRKRLGGG